MNKSQANHLLALVLEASQLKWKFDEASQPESGATVDQEEQAWANYRDALITLFEYADGLEAFA